MAHHKRPSICPLGGALLAGLFLVSGASPQKKGPSLIDKSLAAAFPGAEIERVTCKLSAKQLERVGDIADQKAPKKTTTFAYVARRKGKVVGTAFFDAHKVRTKTETLMVAVSPGGEVLAVDTVVFREPPEYIAQDRFYGSLKGRRQGRALQLGRGLDGTTGATLTCRAVADASRRVLALHEVLGTKVGALKPAKKKTARTPLEEGGKERSALPPYLSVKL